MTEDLMELLRPHLENPELERRKQQEAIQVKQEEQEKERKEKQKRIAEMIKEIEEVAIAIREILQNSCSITIAKKMQDKEENYGMVNVTIWSFEEKVSVVVNKSPFKDSTCLKRGLKIVADKKTDMIIEGLDDSCVENLHSFLSSDNVKVTYE